MISVRLQGRLGNQMFQYAFIIVAAQKLNTSFYLDQYIERSVLDNYFDISGRSHKAAWRVFGITGYKNLFSHHLKKRFYKFIAALNKLEVKDLADMAVASSVILKDHTLYLGYFQSENFFKEWVDLIRQKFTLKGSFVKEFNTRHRDLYSNKKIVTVHIRRTDYQGLGHLNLGGDDLSLPIAYYKNAIALFGGQNVHFVFVSDDRRFVEQNFADLSNKTISTDNEINDFQHLLNAHACIISNSTFSWWGAWLNQRADKVVYAPKYFLGWRIQTQIPAEIYPDNWIQIDF